MSRTIRGIPINALLNYRNANLGAFLLGIFYLIFPWMTSGVLDETTAIFGLMFLTISIMRAKGSNTVIGGLCQAFIGISYFLAIANIINIATLWTLTLILAAIFFVMELGFIRFGPVTKKADAFQLVPFTLLSFILLLSIAGYSPVLRIDWNNTLVAINYVAIFLFSALSMLQLAGWNVAGKNTNQWLMIFAIVAIGTALFGTYQGTLWQWT